MPILVVVLNDTALSLIEIKQTEGQGGANAVRYSDVDFAAAAGAFGMSSRQVTTCEELGEALDAALAQQGPFLIDAIINAAGYERMLQALRGGIR